VGYNDTANGNREFEFTVPKFSCGERAVWSDLSTPAKNGNTVSPPLEFTGVPDLQPVPEGFLCAFF
jgi:hypothetical protein